MKLFFNQFSYYIKAFSIILFFTFSISSCIPPDVKGTADTQFFDLKGFLDNQIQLLEDKEKQGITITKKTVLQGQKAEQTLSKIDWKDEFAFFYSSDINTPQLRDSYKIDKTPQKWTFKTDEQKLIVKNMEITFDKENDTSFENVKEVFIIQEDKNNLYENNRTLIIKVKNGVLKSYSIKGSEDVILNERQEFLVEGNINL